MLRMLCRKQLAGWLVFGAAVVGWVLIPSTAVAQSLDDPALRAWYYEDSGSVMVLVAYDLRGAEATGLRWQRSDCADRRLGWPDGG